MIVEYGYNTPEAVAHSKQADTGVIQTFDNIWTSRPDGVEYNQNATKTPVP